MFFNFFYTLLLRILAFFGFNGEDHPEVGNNAAELANLVLNIPGIQSLSPSVLDPLQQVAGGRYLHWNYEHLDKWPRTCRSGKSQSPIDIVSDATFKRTKEDLPDIELSNYDQNCLATINNNGLFYEMKFTCEQDPPFFQGIGLTGNYVLDHVEFHWPSEHKIDGRAYPLEVQLVHVSTAYRSLVQALTAQNGVVVISVFYDVVQNQVGSETVDLINEGIKDIFKTPQNPKNLTAPISPDSLLPENIQDHFIYKGSKTTPPCQETIAWIVLEDNVLITESQYRILTLLNDVHGKAVTNANRPIQNLNNRTVISRSSETQYN